VVDQGPRALSVTWFWIDNPAPHPVPNIVPRQESSTSHISCAKRARGLSHACGSATEAGSDGGRLDGAALDVSEETLDIDATRVAPRH